MNRNRYRLVFSTTLGMMVPVAETARRRTKAVSGAAAALVGASLAGVVMAGVVMAGAAEAGALPSVVANALPDHLNAVVNAGVVKFATSSQVHNTINYNTLTINVQDKAIIQWNNGFSIGSQAWVDVNHSAGAAGRVLHRVLGNDPSQIYGRFTSNGQETLINQNGILFGSGAQVDVHTLTASSLDIMDSLFLNGLLSQKGEAKGRPVFEGSNGYVKVLKGARIAAAKGGRVMLLGPTVANAGSITASDGQVVLAAGNKVYLIDSDDANVRGLVVEVDNDGVVDTRQANASVPDDIADAGTDKLGAVTNTGKGFFYEFRPGRGEYSQDAQGNYIKVKPGEGGYAKIDQGLFSERGNITMVGLAVNQRGLARATTSVQLNGSIYLKAQNGVNSNSNFGGSGSEAKLLVDNAGELVLGAGSRTEVLPDADTTLTLTDSQTFNRSQVLVAGKTILMEADAGIVAPGGEVTFSATLTPSNPQHESSTAAAADGVRVDFQAGSFVNVAGTTDMQVAASRNVVQAELRGDELKDSPLQRNSILKGKKIWVDVGKGTPLADVSGYTSALGRTVGEKSATGGDILVKSEGDIIMRTGATFDISGGSVAYTPGQVPTTILISSGALVDISEAPLDRAYTGIAGQYTIFNPKFGVDKTVVLLQAYRYESGYVEGKDAGKATFVSPWLVKNGTVHSSTVTGPHQRDLARQPRPGEVLIGSVNGFANTTRLISSVLFGTPLADPLVGMDNPLPDAYKNTLVLSPDFGRDGVGKLRVYSNGEITIPKEQGITLAAAGQRKAENGNTPYNGGLTLSGARVTVESNIRVPSGEIVLEARGGSGFVPAVTVADGVQLDASGVWTNDSLKGAGADNKSRLAYQGGRVAIVAARDLLLGKNSLVDVSGGGWLQASGGLKGGDAGSIELGSDTDVNLVATAQKTSRTVLDGELRGEALGKGGTLTIKAARVVIRDTPRDAADPQEHLVLAPQFFNQGGFAEYSIEGVDGLGVAPGTTIAPVVSSLELRPSALVGNQLRAGGALLLSGADMQTVAQAAIRPAHLRQAAKLTLKSGSQYFGELNIGTGASLRTEPGGTINLNAGRQLTVNGELIAQGGTIALTLDGKPSDSSDPGFRAEQTLWLGATSRLDASGVAKTYVDGKGQTQGEALNGGQVRLTAKKGYVVQEAGSVIDVSGAPPVYLGTRNAQGGLGQSVASDAGSISVTAREGVFMDGVLKGQAGSAAARGGSLSAALNRSEGDAVVVAGGNVLPEATLGFSLYPTVDRELVVRDAGTSVPVGLRAGDAVPLSENGKAYVNLGGLERMGKDGQGGFERFALKSDTNLVFQGPLDIGKDRDLRALTLDAQRIVSADGQPVNLRARYISLGNTAVEQNALTALGTAGHLTVQADLIDFIGKLTLDNLNAQFLSKGDIRFRGYNPLSFGDKVFNGGLTTAGALDFNAAQLYPTTLSRFEVRTDAVSQTITITNNGNTRPAPLSAAGSLSFEANSIDQGGTVLAPFGALSFKATDALTLKPGSVTSVAGRDAQGNELVVPFGSTLNGREWVYYDAPIARFDDDAQIPRLAELPAKRIDLNGKSVNVEAAVGSKAAANVDLSGGGDLQAYEFFVGPGGSRDILADQGVYAILPAYQGGYAPTDVQADLNFDRLPGDQVYLAGGNGLPAGLYTLLPAHYALLPGAYRVRPMAGSKDFFPGQGYIKADGVSVVPGFLADARYDTTTGTGQRDARWSAFEVLSRAQVFDRSELGLTSANRFFPVVGADINLPRDAGTLAFNLTGTELILAGKFDLNSSGRGAAVDIAAPKIVVAVNGTAGLDADALMLDPTVLSGLGAESLLLGGVRPASGGAVIDVKASEVVVVNNKDSALTAPEVLLAATGKVEVRGSNMENGGSVVQGVGGKPGVGRDYSAAGEGALLLASSQDSNFSRTGNPGTTNGELIIGDNAQVTANRSLVLDATKDTANQGKLTFADKDGKSVVGGRLTLGASRISMGVIAGDVPTSATGLKFSQSDLNNFNKLDSLTFNSYSGFDLYGAPVVGGAQLKALSLNGGGVRGFDNVSKIATLQADTVRLSNSAGVSAGDAGTGSGTLEVKARTLVLAEGDKTLSGFGALNVNASEIIGAGSGKLDAGAANVTLTTARITGQSGATQALTSIGSLTTVRQALDQALAPASGLGAQWNFTASNISHGASIEMPAGHVFMTATGGDIVIENSGNILAKGVSVPFADTSVAAPGGKVVLTAKTGKVKILASHRPDDVVQVDVSAAPGGEAGHIGIAAAKGTAEIAENSIRGKADTSRDAATFALDVSKLDAATMDFTTLNTRLNAGGFKRAQDVRVRTGDVSIADTDEVKVHDYILAADSGSIMVEGKIDASGNQGGKIGLYAGNGLNLKTGGKLYAQASGAGERGGKVELAAGAGELHLAGGDIDVSPGAGGEKGEVLLRVARTGADAGDNVNAKPIASNIKGAASVVLEAVKNYGRGTLTATDYITFNSDNTSFITYASAIKTALGQSGNADFHVRPGVEIQSSGDLTVSADWNLYSANRVPGVLTLRAKNKLIVNGSISDGFSTAATTGTLQAGDSWSYRLVAGADLTAANPLATQSGAGNFELKAGKLIRTGTGDIHIAAGGDFDLGKPISGTTNSQNSVIYTAGTLAPDLTDFTNPKEFSGSTKSAVFSQNGGDIDIRVQGDIRGAITTQFYTDWLYRQGKVDLAGKFAATSPQTAWWVRFSEFKQGVAALGGGDVSVRAGKSIVDLSVASVTQGRLAVDSADTRSLQVLGGGDVWVEAGKDIRGGKYYVAKGQGELLAGDSLLGNDVDGVAGLYPVLALGDGQWNARARGDVNLAAVLNPFVMGQVALNVPGSTKVQLSEFLTYGEDSRVDVVSLAGDVRLENNATKLAKSLIIYPASVRAASLQGDLNVLGTIALLPSAQGQLELLADGNIAIGLIHMSDLAAEAVPSPEAPTKGAGSLGLDAKERIGQTLLTSSYKGDKYHAATPRHLLDPQPVRVVAKTGDISGEPRGLTSPQPATILLPKPAIIEAGGEIRNLTLITQHFSESDVTRITARGSIRYPNADDRQFVQVWGPGTLSINAGGDLDLGASLGVVTRGNLDNPALPERGASVQVLTGTARYFERAAEVVALIQAVPMGSEVPSDLLAEARLLTGNPALAAADATPALAQASLLAGTAGRLQQRIEQTLARGGQDAVLLRQAQIMTGDASLTLAGASAALQLLTAKPTAAREADGRAFLTQALNRFGTEAADPKNANFKNYDAAYRSLDLAFPGSNCGGARCAVANYAGDVNLFFSQIKTERGGAIEVLTPGGQILAGLASTPKNLIDVKSELANRSGATSEAIKANDANAHLGIMTLDGGSINLVAADDVLVNQSRVLTVAGGDILAWSSFEDIDAGKGKKTAVSVPPPRTRTGKDGTTITEIQGVASGSGIGTLLTKPGQALSSIRLFAPRGSINAGDAGIRSAGNLTLGAQQVIGADNIQVGGVAVGVPAADAGAISAATGAAAGGGEDVAKTTAALSQNLADAARTGEELKNAFKPTFISAEVIGHGD